jgi:uncharacterized protein YkwD
MRSLAALTVALATVLVWSPVATPGSPTRIEPRDAIEAAVVREINRVRVARGRPPVRVAPSLRTAARRHTHAMLTHGFFRHESLDGTRFSVRIKHHYTDRGWASWSVGEALLASTGSSVEASVVVAAWLRSASHRDIILSPGWRDTGIGALYASAAPHEFDSAETVIVTADFGLRERRAGLP